MIGVAPGLLERTVFPSSEYKRESAFTTRYFRDSKNPGYDLDKE